MKWLELGVLAEIIDRSGIVRQTAGCSIVGRRDFAARLDRINQILSRSTETEPDRTWYDIYGSNAEFRHCVVECLRLNSLDPDWFTPHQIEALLLPHFNEDGDPVQGELVTLNSPPPTTNKRKSAEPQLIEEVIACLSEDLEQAMMLATEVPAEVAIGINQAQAKSRLSDEERQELERQAQRPDPEEIKALLLGA